MNKPEGTTLFIKNMVCGRCIKVVKEELENLGLHVNSIQLGEVRVSELPGQIPLDSVKAVLEENGFELLEDRRAKIIEQIKLEIIGLVRNNEVLPEKNLSEYLTSHLNLDYHYLTTLFSSVENITIEQYFITQKIEKVKELLKYGENTLSEISFKLGYSSVQHLSNQFKKITGMTASEFRNFSQNLRKPLDQVTA